MTVYADSLFLINFISVYLLLTLTEKILSAVISIPKKMLASVLGAATAAAVFCAVIPQRYSTAVQIADALLIAFVSYRGSRKKVFEAAAAIFALSCIYPYIAVLFIKNGAVIKNGIVYAEIPFGLFAVIFICTYSVILLFTKLIKIKKKTYCISFFHNGSSLGTTALYDSGNLLSDGQKSVIVAEWSVIKQLLGMENYEELYTHIDSMQLKILPFRTLDKGAGAAVVFYADKIHIKENGSTFYKVPVGIINNSISSGYHALIGKEYI